MLARHGPLNIKKKNSSVSLVSIHNLFVENFRITLYYQSYLFVLWILMYFRIRYRTSVCSNYTGECAVYLAI